MNYGIHNLFKKSKDFTKKIAILFAWNKEDAAGTGDTDIIL